MFLQSESTLREEIVLFPLEGNLANSANTLKGVNQYSKAKGIMWCNSDPEAVTLDRNGFATNCSRHVKGYGLQR